MTPERAAKILKTGIKGLPGLFFTFALVACGGGGMSTPPPPPPAAPAISSFSPTSGPATTPVIVTGSNFSGATSVRFNGMSATFTVNSGTQISTSVPAGATTGKISVTTAGGTANSGASFSVGSSMPTVTTFAPTSGAAGVSVTITGTNFTGTTAVSFNGTAATFVVNSGTQIAATVPAGATTGKISVTNATGTAMSASNFTVLPPAPTISSFSPTSGLVGAAVTVNGANFTGATAVKFNGTNAPAFTIVSATQITVSVPSAATSGKISVTTPGGTATSAGNFTVMPSPPTITAFAPASGQIGLGVTITGTNFTGATSVKFNGTNATFTISSATQIATTVPTAATTGKISVTTPGGTATSANNFTVTPPSATLDLTIDGAYVTQATQDYPTPTVPLVKDRSAWVRVFVKANQANTATPQVRVRFIKGTTTNTLTINSTLTSVPTSVDPNTLTSWDAAVSSAWIQPSTQIVADVDPAGAIPEADKTNNSFTANLDVRTLKPWKITLIPVKTGTRTATVTSATRTKESWLDFAKRIHPVPDAIDIAVGSLLTSSVTTLSSDGTGWSTVLNELDAKRTAEGATDRYYFGAVNVSYSSGVAGLGFIGHPAAIGWDFFPSAQSVLAHEEGHNFNRPHSPCGGAGNPDPAFPYPGGLIGVPGWDVFAASNNRKDPATYTDIMAYCNPQWISDYVYTKELTFRAGSAIGVIVSDVVGSAPTEGLLVWGTITDGVVTLEPAFRVPYRGAVPASGPYVAEARDLSGQMLASLSFDAHEVADLPDDKSVQMFSFVVPLSQDALNRVASLRIARPDGSELTHRVTRVSSFDASAAAAVDRNVEMLDLPDGSIQFTWDAERFPVIMVRDARSGEVRGFLRGGQAELKEAPPAIDVQVSDGVQSRQEFHARGTQ